MKTKKQSKAKQQILNTIPIFLAKTYKIVDNSQYNEIISWTQDGQGFIVKDINRLTTQIFPKHFKHSNFASFVRQLNMYGFHKIKSQEDGHVFTHECFQKDQIEKLQQIKRRSGVVTQQQGNESNMMVPLRRSQQSQFQKELNIIKSKHEDLQSFVSMLVQQNKEILMQNRNFVNKMSKMQEKYRNKLQTLMLLLLFGKAKNSNGQPFILPQQFQSMLESFGEGNSFPVNEEGKKKKQKRDMPMKMLKNQSQAQILRRHQPQLQRQQMRQKQMQEKQGDHDEIQKLISQIDGEKLEVQKPREQMIDDSIDLVMPSPIHSYIQFPELYEKDYHHDEHDMSGFLDKFPHSDYEDLPGLDDKLHD